MRTWLWFILRLFGVAFLLTGSIGWSAEVHALEVLTIGDSITQGLQRNAGGGDFGITLPVNGAANIGGYQPRLKSKVDANIEPSNLYNWGIGGEFSTGGVSRISSVLTSRKADFILIMYGANDVFAGISSNTTRANLGNMIDQSKARNVVPIISEITPNIYVAGGKLDVFIANDYNPKLKSIAAEKDTEIVLMFAEMKAGWKNLYNSGDGVHLSNLGFEKMSQEWFEVIDSVYQMNSLNLVPFLVPLLLD